MEKRIRTKIKIVLYGPECTGKSTLAEGLAKAFNATWTPEFAREYLQNIWNQEQRTCEPNDLIPIAKGQLQWETEELQKAEQLLFCDTDVFLTQVWGELYYGQKNTELSVFADKLPADLYLLTDIDLKWVPDDLRDRPKQRQETLAFFENQLIALNKPYIKISGKGEHRLANAIKIVEQYMSFLQLGFTSHDFMHLNNREITPESVSKQLHYIRKGVPWVHLNRIATTGDGILQFTEDEITYFTHLFDNQKGSLKIKKMVPASGAASRMFKFLSEFLEDYKLGQESINAYINRAKNKHLSLFLVGLPNFPFYELLLKKTKVSFPDYNSWSHDLKNYALIKTLLDESGLNYANKPKGILPFHKYETHIATPVEEHLREALAYAVSSERTFVHFTVSPEHQESFETLVESLKSNLEEESTYRINVNYSTQRKSTDSLAFNSDLHPIRTEDGRLLFRPGGHGALIENINNIDADILFIKNIDNVIQNHLETISHYKKSLGGVLLNTQRRVFHYLEQLDRNNLQKEEMEEVVGFIKTQLSLDISEDFPKFTRESKIEYLHNYLNRPIRVCGMVKNEGEPGGGPFWVRNQKGYVFLQIVESSQIDMNDPDQKQIFESSTHFNPVDLVCGIRNYKGERFDMLKFTDPDTGFVVKKNKNGIDLLAYELPGLWNGSMAKWLTIFVEVPLITFSPVKTVNDLLKPAHQSPHAF
jgi:nicotinamide riboside kinase